MQGVVDHTLQISGRSGFIPTDNIGKLSYYLYCLEQCMPGSIHAPLTNYENSFNFSQTDQETIITICCALKPSTLDNRVIFKASDDEIQAIKPGFSNAFLPVNEKIVKTTPELGQNIPVGLNPNCFQAIQTMMYTETWITSFYFTPLVEIERQLKWAEQEGTRIQAAAPSNYTVPVGYNQAPSNVYYANNIQPIAQPSNNMHPMFLPHPSNNTDVVINTGPANDYYRIKEDEIHSDTLICCFILVAFFGIFGVCCAYCIVKEKLPQNSKKFWFYSVLPGFITSMVLYVFFYF